MSLILGILAQDVAGAGAANSYESIATVTVGSGGSGTITFSSIPSTFEHLQIRAIAQTNRATYNTSGASYRINSDTGSNYAYHLIQSDPASPSTAVNAGASSSTNILGAISLSSSVATNVFGAFVMDILDYKNTNKYKTVRILSGADTNGAASGFAGFMQFSSGLWQSTSAVSTLTFTPADGTQFNQYSTFALYGIKGA
jgi:hypothetical protein